MNVIACVDPNLGLLFNHRRVSFDPVIINEVNKYAKTDLMIEAISHDLFPDALIVKNPNEFSLKYFFLENYDFKQLENVEYLIIYNFNRSYPSDYQLNVKLEEYQLISQERLISDIHPQLERLVYRCKK